MNLKPLYLAFCLAGLAFLCLSCDNHSVIVEACPTPGFVECQGTCIDPMTSDIYCGANEDCENYSVCVANHMVCNQGICMTSPNTPDPNSCIKFTDQAIQAYAMLMWDANKDTCISPAEADAVTQIPTQAFKNNSQLTSLNDLNQFPNLTTIQEEAFSDCPNLTALELEHIQNIAPNAFNGSPLQHIKLTNIETLTDNFNDVSTLTSIELPHLKTLDGCFSFCPITSVSLPEVKIIKNSFLECTSLTSINLPEAEEITSSFDYAEITTLSLPKATHVNAFERCTALTSIDMPKAVKIIGFNDSIALTSLNLPEVTEIDGFDTCHALTSLSLPKAINVNGFDNCKALTSLTLPEAASVSGFTSAEALTTIDLPKAMSINGFTSCKALTSLTLPAAETISTHAFFCATSLETLNLPKAKTIDSHAFATGESASQEIPDCHTHSLSLTALYLPEIESIGPNALDAIDLSACINASDAHTSQWTCAAEQWCKKTSDIAWACQ